jgi:hypothetical protein
MRSLTRLPHKHEKYCFLTNLWPLPCQGLPGRYGDLRCLAEAGELAGSGPRVTAVVRCDPVVRGPDVAPWVPSLEGASGPVLLA